MSAKPEYLASVCLVEETSVADELATIAVLVRAAQKVLQYWEIIYVASESSRHAIEAAISAYADVKDLRIVIVRDDVGYYSRRAIAAGEAIGDVVVLTSFNELNECNPFVFAEEAVARNQAVVGHTSARERPSFLYSLMGMITDFRVDARSLKTIAVPRDLLVGILARPTAPIDLRFEPKRGVLPYVAREVKLTRTGGEANFGQRVELLAAMFSASAPRFLSFFALLSSATALFAIAYGIYAVFVYALVTDVQPGWFTTTLAQSGATTLVAIGLAVIALGIGNIIDRLQTGARHEIVEEIGNITFYQQVSDFNVERGRSVETDPAE